MKKLQASVITLLLLLSVCLIAAFPTSAADVNYDDFEIYDGVLVEYIGEDSEVVVPSVDRDGNPVTHIDSRAFRDNKTITSVVVSEGIETMGKEVFEYCENLVEATLPYSLLECGYSTFRHTSLHSIVIPGQLKEVPSDFIVSGGNCSDVVISPGGEVVKGGSLYVTCSEIIFPDSVYEIGASTFSYQHVDMSIYICNPDCELGAPGYASFKETVGPIWWARAGAKSELKIYSLKDSAVEEFVNQYQKGTTSYNDSTGLHCEGRFVPIKQEKLDEYQAKCEERGITEVPEEPKEPENDPDKGTTSGDEGNTTTGGSKNNGTGNNNGSVSTDNNLMMVIIIVAAAFFLIIIIIVVVVLVVVMNKKNKKKNKKKKAKPAEPVAEAPAEEPVVEETAEEAPAEEEKGEEE